MKLYISAASISEIREAQKVYDARKARYDSRMLDYEQGNRDWQAAYADWQEALKTNSEAPRPDPEKVKTVFKHPKYDPEYEIDSYETELTAKVLNYISGKEYAVRSKYDDDWFIVLSGPYMPKTGTYYKCIRYSKYAFGGNTGEPMKLHLDRVHLKLPVEILTFEELAEYLISQGVCQGFPYDYMLNHIQEHAHPARR